MCHYEVVDETEFVVRREVYCKLYFEDEREIEVGMKGNRSCWMLYLQMLVG
jgi:hypothetical protein